MKFVGAISNALHSIVQGTIKKSLIVYFSLREIFQKSKWFREISGRYLKCAEQPGAEHNQLRFGYARRDSLIALMTCAQTIKTSHAHQ